MHRILLQMLHYCCTVTMATHQVAFASAAEAHAFPKSYAEEDPELRYTSTRLNACRHVWGRMLYCVMLRRTRRAQVIACSSLLHHDQRAWAADAAPNSEELVWANLG